MRNISCEECYPTLYYTKLFFVTSFDRDRATIELRVTDTQVTTVTGQGIDPTYVVFSAFGSYLLIGQFEYC